MILIRPCIGTCSPRFSTCRHKTMSWLKPLRASSALSIVLLFVAIGPSALSVTSCASRKTEHRAEVSTVQTYDSLDVTESRVTIPTYVPPAMARMSISLSNLRQLPPSAMFESRSGRAQVRASTHGDTVYITALCDSLLRAVEIYERRAVRAQKENKELRARLTDKVQTGSGMSRLVFALVAGCCSGAIITIITSKRYGRNT